MRRDQFDVWATHAARAQNDWDDIDCQFDFKRLDWGLCSRGDFRWPEALLAELATGWLAFDRDGTIGPEIARCTVYDDVQRLTRLDEALIGLDQLLGNQRVTHTWSRLGAAVAHDRLNCAYELLIQALFDTNRCWRPWRSRELTHHHNTGFYTLTLLYGSTLVITPPLPAPACLFPSVSPAGPLDDFTRANGVIGGSWLGTVTSTNGFAIAGNTLSVVSANALGKSTCQAFARRSRHFLPVDAPQTGVQYFHAGLCLKLSD